MSVARAARVMLRTHRYGALSTISARLGGHPFGSIVPFLMDHDGTVLIFISALAEHTRNIMKDPRVSLIAYDGGDDNPQAQGRVTIIGHSSSALREERLASRYLRYFPDARPCFEMSDFSFYRICPATIRYIAGFGEIHWVKIDDYRVTGHEAFADREQAILTDLNGHRRDLLRGLFARRYGIGTEDVQAIGYDCDGLDVLHGGRIWRVNLENPTCAPSLEALQSLIG